MSIRSDPCAPRCEHSVENECFCQRLAAAAGLSVAGSLVLPVKGKRYYVTERYDRKVVGERVERYLQEDFCLAMGDEGCPSPIYARIGEVIREQVKRVKVS